MFNCCERLSLIFLTIVKCNILMLKYLKTVSKHAQRPILFHLKTSKTQELPGAPPPGPPPGASPWTPPTLRSLRSLRFIWHFKMFYNSYLALWINVIEDAWYIRFQILERMYWTILDHISVSVLSSYLILWEIEKVPYDHRMINPLNPGQFPRRVYRLPQLIRDNVPVSVSVSVFWQRNFWQLLHFTYFHIYCSLTGTMYSSVSVSKSDFLII